MLNVTLEKIKEAIGITGEYQDNTVQTWIDEVVDYLKDAGVAEENITNGIVARGVSDLWNYGAGEGKLSPYFYDRATQLALKGKKVGP